MMDGHALPPPVAETSKKKTGRSSSRAAHAKRRCISTACIACRRRKSKCDGALPACAACSSVYGTECVYDPSSDHRRKGVYRDRADALKTKNTTLQVLIHAILNAAEDDVPALIHQIRTCESLDDVADALVNGQSAEPERDDEPLDAGYSSDGPAFGTEITGKMAELRLENGSIRFLGGTSNLLYFPPTESDDELRDGASLDTVHHHEEPLTSWTRVTDDTELIVHLVNMYFTWHYPYFTTLSKELFYRDFLRGRQACARQRTMYCSPLLVNAILALGCHFSSSPASCADPADTSTRGDAFFQEAKRLIVENDEYERPRLTTIQALALMSVREAGCGREQKGWVYSGMSFRMAHDMGLNLDSGNMGGNRENMDEHEIDARRITFWGCFQFDKCWSNYLGRIPQLLVDNITVPKYDVFPDEDAALWTPYTDSGLSETGSQPSRIRTVARQMSTLCEISSDLLVFFYNPQYLGKPVSKSAEMKKLGELQTRLEAWRRDLPKELEVKEGQMPQVLLVHMFFHLLYIHLFRPFLKYSPTTSPLPAHVSPRRQCVQAAASISKIMRLYKRNYGLRQICNIAVYMVHSACTIHLLNLHEKTAKRDIVHGLKNLEEIAEGWLCARRTLSILSVQARKWKIDLPDEASQVLSRTDARYGSFNTSDIPSPQSKHDSVHSPGSSASSPPAHTPSSTTHSAYPPAERKPGLMAPHGTPHAVPMANNMAAAAAFLPSDLLPPSRPAVSRPPAPVMTAAQMPAQAYSTAGLKPALQKVVGVQAASPARAALVPDVPSLHAASTPVTDTFPENHQWWLKDQANLLVDFDNWDGIDLTADLSASGLPGAALAAGHPASALYPPVHSQLLPGAYPMDGPSAAAAAGGQLREPDDEWYFP